MPLVSIIIPVYNTSECIERCIASCINQTFTNIEILVINDGSTDNSLVQIQKMAESDQRICIINKENEGVALARKRGINEATGEYLFFLDSDDYIEEDTIASLYNLTISHKSDISIGGFFVEKEEEKTSILYPYEGIWEKHEFISYTIDNYAFSICGRLIKKKIFDKVHYIKAEIGEDLVLALQVYTFCQNIIVENRLYYHYIYRYNSTMNDIQSKKKALKELSGTIAIFELLNLINFRRDEHNKLLYIAIDKICFHLCTCGEFGDKKEWIKHFIKKYFIKNREVRNYIWAKNRKIYIQLFISYFLSPKIAQTLSSIRRFFK